MHVTEVPLPLALSKIAEAQHTDDFVCKFQLQFVKLAKRVINGGSEPSTVVFEHIPVHATLVNLQLGIQTHKWRSNY